MLSSDKIRVTSFAVFGWLFERAKRPLPDTFVEFLITSCDYTAMWAFLEKMQGTLRADCFTVKSRERIAGHIKRIDTRAMEICVV